MHERKKKPQKEEIMCLFSPQRFPGANATPTQLLATALKPGDATQSDQDGDGGGAGALNLACWGPKGPEEEGISQKGGGSRQWTHHGASGGPGSWLPEPPPPSHSAPRPGALEDLRSPPLGPPHLHALLPGI